ncbi:MAG: uroporphyrinogen decarboxylase family protein [Planctomycetota bacterium]
MSAVVETEGKALVLGALRGHTTPRTPWVPFVGCHAAALLELSAEEYLRSTARMVEGVSAAIERYQPDGIPVAFDLQIEAEALGCKLKWSADNPPSVTSHPLAAGAQLGDLKIPRLDEGRLAAVFDAARQLGKNHREIALYGLVTGPFTLALHLLGTEIFMRMFDTPTEVHALMGFAGDVALAAGREYHRAGCHVVALVDPMTSQIGPDQFREFVAPYTQPVFEALRAQGCLTSFFVCGHAQKNIEAMCECRPDNISVDENIPLSYVRDTCRDAGVSFGGNMQLTSVLLLGTPEDAERNALDCLQVGGNRGFVLAPGCDLPYATPPDNLAAVGRLVRDEYRQSVIRTLAVPELDDDRLDMSQYGHDDRVVVDVITLDSEACTPCQYMVEAVRRVAPQFEGIVHWREHKIKHPESLVFMTSLLVKNVPTICIDGEIKFVSRIPPQEELIEAIQQRINEKMRGRISRRRGAIVVLGPDDPRRADVVASIQRAIAELGADVDLSLVADPEEIRSYGVHPSQTPAVVTVRCQVRSMRQVPEVPVVKEWIKGLR